MPRQFGTHPADGAWAPLSRAVLRPAGPSAPDRTVWLTRLALLALLLAAGWWLFALLRPLPRPSVEGELALPEAPALPKRSNDIAERERRLAALTVDNPFAADRAMWSGALASGAEPSALEKAGLPDPSRAPDDPPASRAATPPHASGFQISSPVGNALAVKLKEVELRGVYSLSREPVALIGLVKDRPFSRSLRVGDTFDDGAWKVVAINLDADSVIISRAGENFELLLYPDAPALPVVAAAPQTEPAPAVHAPPVVEHRTQPEVEAALAKSGLAADDIAELIKLATAPDEAPPEPGAAAVAEAPAAAVDPAAPADGAPGAAKPAGLDAILKIMSSTPVGDAGDRPAREKKPKRKKGEESPAAAPPAPSPQPPPG